MLFWAIRGFFLLVWAGIAALLANRLETIVPPAVVVGCVMLLAGGAVAIDVFMPRQKVPVFSAIFFGLIVGVAVSQLLLAAIGPLVVSWENLVRARLPAGLHDVKPIETGVTLIVVSLLSYVCISFVLQTKDQFRFIIPYVEFSRETKGTRPLLLDTSVIIDGRIADMSETRVFDNPMVVPGFVLQELQMVADSSDKLKRNRGRRGLDVLNRLRASPSIQLETNDVELPEFQTVRGVDQRLVFLAKHMNAKIMTNDFNLNKLAKVQGVDVINLNDVANALKPVVLPGEAMTVRLTKPGDQPGQGVGYLDDGTMVVAEQGRGFIGEEVRLVVTSVLQTSAGRMIFGRLDGPPAARQ
jgi:uncharacterized protein YacL